jgi:arylsulfatase A-like enzyme
LTQSARQSPPRITGTRKQLHTALYAAFLDRQRAVRAERWKAIWTPNAGRVQLFDLKRDPWETRNLAPIPKYASTLAELQATLLDLMDEMKDPMPREKVFGSSQNQ